MNGTLQIVGSAELITLALGEDGPTETFMKEMMAYWKSESKRWFRIWKHSIWNGGFGEKRIKWWKTEVLHIHFVFSLHHPSYIWIICAVIFRKYKNLVYYKGSALWIVSRSCRRCSERRFNTMSIRLILLGFTVLSVPSTLTYRIQLSRISKTHTTHNSTISSKRKRLRYLLMRG